MADLPGACPRILGQARQGTKRGLDAILVRNPRQLLTFV
jgi:hypothetical protein